MDYKRRMLIEFDELITRKTKLDIYLSGLTETTNELEKKKLELMQKQFNLMSEYEEILLQRILLEMN